MLKAIWMFLLLLWGYYIFSVIKKCISSISAGWSAQQTRWWSLWTQKPSPNGWATFPLMSSTTWRKLHQCWLVWDTTPTPTPLTIQKQSPRFILSTPHRWVRESQTIVYFFFYWMKKRYLKCKMIVFFYLHFLMKNYIWFFFHVWMHIFLFHVATSHNHSCKYKHAAQTTIHKHQVIKCMWNRGKILQIDMLLNGIQRTIYNVALE